MTEPVAGFDQWRAIAADGVPKTYAICRSAIANLLTVIGRRHAVAVDGEHFERVGNVFQGLRAETAVAERDFPLHLVISLT